MAATASKRQGAKSQDKQMARQRWLEETFAEHWAARLETDLARPKFVPKPKRVRAKKKR